MKKRIFNLLIIILLTLFINNITSDKNIYADDETPVSIVYSGHSQSIGWQNKVSNGTMAGTTGKSLRFEAFYVNLQGIDGSISYRSYVEGGKWQNYVSDGTVSGTTGQKKNIYAVQMKLSGEVAEKYDLYYQVHKSNIGWTGWVKGGTELGTDSLTKKIEALQILLIPKGGNAPSNIPLKADSPSVVSYSAHVSNIGWQDYTSQNGVGGTTHQNRRLEALKINLPDDSEHFSIEYSLYSANKGWDDWVSNNEIAGAEGINNVTRALRVRLTGYLSANYSIYYRTYSTDSGWSDWVCDGETSGKISATNTLEAVQVTMIKKGDAAPSSALPITSLTPINLRYSTHIQSIGWQSYKNNSEISGTTGQAKRLEAFTMSFNGVSTSQLGIRYRAYCQTYGWLNWTNNGGIAGTTGESKRLEAIELQLTGSLADNYDIYYRTHCQSLGWLDWASNGNTAGTTELAYRVEAIQVIILPKGATPPGPTQTPYVTKTYPGIDVSYWQGTIDWNKVAASGIKFAMVRIQHGKDMDTRYKTNLKEADRAGISVGAYVYSTATNVEEAKAEAYSIVNALKGYNITYPVAYDLESERYQGNLSNRTRTDMVLAFKKIIEANGYKFVLYVNKNWLESKLNYNELKGVDVWFARYRDYNLSFDNPDDKGNNKIKFPSDMVTMWQYTSEGSVPGISGNVDLDVSYKTYDLSKR